MLLQLLMYCFLCCNCANIINVYDTHTPKYTRECAPQPHHHPALSFDIVAAIHDSKKKKKNILFAIDIKGRRSCMCVRVYCSCYHCCFVHSLPFVVKYLIFINKLKNKITHHLLYHLLSAADWPFSRTGLRMVNRMCIGFLAFISHSLS